MDRRVLWSALRRFWPLVLAFILAGGGTGAALELNKQTAYVATIRMFATVGAGDNVPASQSTALAVQRMTSYVRLADTTKFSDRLISRLALDVSDRALARRISASLEKDTVMMNLTVGGASPEEVRRISEVAASEYTSMVNQLNDVSSTDSNATLFTTVDGPQVRPSSSLRKLALSSGFGVIVGAALGLAVALTLSRNLTGRSPVGLSSRTGLPVVGIIPKTGRHPSDPWFDGLNEQQRLACHRLVRNMPHLGVDSAGRPTVVVLAPTAQTDTTAVAIGLAAAMSERGLGVLLVDSTYSIHGAGERLSAPATTPLIDVINGTVDVRNATASISDAVRFDLASYGPEHRRAVSAGERTREITLYRSFSKNYNAVVIDGSGLLGQHELSTTMERADAIILVVEHGAGLRQEVRSAVDVLAAMSSVPVGLVVTQADPGSIPHDQFLSGVVLADTARAVG